MSGARPRQPARGEALAYTPRVVPRWLPPVSLGCAVVGLLVSAWLTFEHYSTEVTLACPAGEAFDCVKVTQSPWSSFLGMPVALLGLGYFVVTVALTLPAVWRRSDRRLDLIRLAWTGVGVAFVAYLVWAEVARIHSICLWCTAVHVATVVLCCVLVFGRILTVDPEPIRDSAKGRRRR